mgnify:CR=1 FL=1
MGVSSVTTEALLAMNGWVTGAQMDLSTQLRVVKEIVRVV